MFYEKVKMLKKGGNNTEAKISLSIIQIQIN